MIRSFVHSTDIPIIDKLYNLSSKFWIAGGTPLNWYQHKPADSDIDLFFNNRTDYLKLDTALENKLPQTWSDPFKSLTTVFDKVSTAVGRKSYHATDDLTVIDRLATENAVTYTLALSNYTPVDKGPQQTWKVQLIKRKFYKDITDVIADFDITVCQIATNVVDRVVTGEKFAEDVAARRLRFTKMTPSSAKRLIKYWSYGFNPTDDDIQSVMDCPDLDLTKREDDY